MAERTKYSREEIIDFLRLELLQGKTKSMLLRELKNGEVAEFDFLKGKENEAIYKYIDAAYESCAIECEENKKKQRELAYERFLDLYREARKKGDNEGARKVMADICKLTGLNEPEKIELGETIFQINLV